MNVRDFTDQSIFVAIEKFGFEDAGDDRRGAYIGIAQRRDELQILRVKNTAHDG